MVLQVMGARDISSPKRASGSSGRRMLRLDLTDGDATVVAVEYRELTSVEDASALAPGTKVAVPPGVRIRCQSGILLAHGDVLRVLGGKVAALAEEWEGVRAVAVFAGTDAETGGTDAPRFETYDREKADATVAAAVAGRTAANRAVAEAIAEKRAAFNQPRAPRRETEPAPSCRGGVRAAPDPRAASRRSGRGREAPASRRAVPPPREDGDWTDRGARGRAGDVAWAELREVKEVKKPHSSPDPASPAVPRPGSAPRRGRDGAGRSAARPARVYADRH